MPPTSSLDLLTIRETLADLRMSERTAYRLLAAGTFPVPAFKVGGQWRVRRADLEALGSSAAAS